MATKKKQEKRPLTKSEYKRLVKAFTNYRDTLGKLMTKKTIDDQTMMALVEADHKLSFPRKIKHD